ncbi:MAG: Holliday junction resolvase RuvX [Rhodospirillaceae bacterium]|jgi:putative holliday junction resolvase|nr:Holliday junction resolvase RuvX [Rhodospirillaceae bacterium]MBT5374737.1 Holliday junction resolvase RuvX [Rhodospirillaceae bacterium]MBT5660138.1 Holliday junction resolvase RuvX [Rhodospirillaceae bacterium]MBT5752209.1 Holliday junction resolvase RuvX [Rhodospirillaceae bacterium]
MAVCNPTELTAQMELRGRILGLDVGEKTIGLAISDASYSIATPVETLRRKKFTADAEALIAIIQERNVGALVVGLPINMDGSEGPRCQSMRQFAENLLGKIDLPLAFWDERLSTAAVTRTLIEADMSRKRRSQVVDKMAAAYILQGFLDHLHHQTATP